MTNEQSDRRIRLTIEVSQAGYDRIELLKRRFGSQHTISLLNSSLNMLEWAVTQIEAGRVIGSLNRKTFEFNEAVSEEIKALKDTIEWGSWNTDGEPEAES